MEIIIKIFDVFPAGTQPGIDVSHYDGEIDWPTVSHSGVAFAYAKASEGTSAALLDAFFPANWSGMKDAGILRGAYHFFRPELDASAQAQQFLAQLANANGGSSILRAGDLPAVLDLEVIDSVAPANIFEGAAIWLETVESATGRQPILYTYGNYWREMLGNPQSLSQYPLWFAETGVTTPNIPGGWNNWTIWQFDAQPVAGISSTAVDLDAFNGSIDDLFSLAGWDFLPFGQLSES